MQGGRYTPPRESQEKPSPPPLEPERERCLACPTGGQTGAEWVHPYALEDEGHGEKREPRFIAPVTQQAAEASTSARDAQDADIILLMPAPSLGGSKIGDRLHRATGTTWQVGPGSGTNATECA